MVAKTTFSGQTVQAGFGPVAIAHWFRQIWLATANLLVPPRCAFCGADVGFVEGKPLLCDPCIRLLVLDTWDHCPRCGALTDKPMHVTQPTGPLSSNHCPRCRKKAYYFDQVIPLGPYCNSLRAAILRMKRQAGDHLSRAIGDLYARRRFGELASLRPDVVVPIPMHWRPRVMRGTNSPEIMAQRISRHLGVPFERAMLIRHRNTIPQEDLSPTKRFENVRGAFRLRRGYDIKSSRILLIDDVMTTGATCSEAAKALKKAGAKAVFAAVAARTVLN